VNPANNRFQPIIWLGDRARILDQTQLPGKEAYLDIDDYGMLCAAIKGLKIRGAPAIGVAGAYAVVLGALKLKVKNRETFLNKLAGIIDEVWVTRPTARNLFFALERVKTAAAGGKDPADVLKRLIKEAGLIQKYEAGATARLSRYGAALLKDGWTVLTHCNAGPLATCGDGTALGVIIAAREQGKGINVIADETRPLLQGARLTTWELQKSGVPVELITDSMAGHFMKAGKINCVITGADRITANGDTANKIGTYSIAVLAKENKIPFYIAAPVSTIDVSLKTGDEIPIEERNPEEVTHFNNVRIAPEGVDALNPAFDVTPHRYIAAIITDKGVIKPPYTKSIASIID
jgi:methylthioribose-1-phosphate isomerase